MNLVRYKVTGYSKATETLVFECDIDEPSGALKALLKIEDGTPLVDVYELFDLTQRSFFSEKYQIQFAQDTDYYVEAYQGGD